MNISTLKINFSPLFNYMIFAFCWVLLFYFVQWRAPSSVDAEIFVTSHFHFTSFFSLYNLNAPAVARLITFLSDDADAAAVL